HDRHRPRAVPVPVPVGHQPAAIPAYGDPRGRARGGPRRGVPHGGRAEGPRDAHHRAYDVLSALRRRHGETAGHDQAPGAPAGRDLYASPRQVFWRITFPLLLPGIIGAALLSFALSFDDFIITYFNAGTVQTFPTFVYISAARGIPAEANVIASAVFILAIAIVLLAPISTASRKKRLRNA